MPVVSVQHCLIDLQQNVQAALGLAQDADAFRVQRPDGTSHYVGIRHVELITGVALFKIHLAWEDFLENVFTRYMCGARTVSGYTPVLLKPPKTKVAVAFTELLGRSKQMNWTAYATVKRSQVYFDSGEPFVTTLSAVTYTWMTWSPFATGLPTVRIMRRCSSGESFGRHWATYQRESLRGASYGW